MALSIMTIIIMSLSITTLSVITYETEHNAILHDTLHKRHSAFSTITQYNTNTFLLCCYNSLLQSVVMLNVVAPCLSRVKKVKRVWIVDNARFSCLKLPSYGSIFYSTQLGNGVPRLGQSLRRLQGPFKPSLVLQQQARGHHCICVYINNLLFFTIAYLNKEIKCTECFP